MSTINLQLPDSLHKRVQAMAERDNVSLDQFIAVALAEKVSALLTEEYLQARAQKGDASRYRQALQKVPDVEPEEADRL